MNFTRLNLKHYLKEGISSSNNLATNAEVKTADAASGIGRQKQMDPNRKEQQIKQRAARSGPTTMAQTVDITPGASTTVESLSASARNLEKQIKIHRTGARAVNLST